MVKEQIGKATLYLGDTREILPTLRDADIILTDPPYHKEFVPLYGLLAREGRRMLPVGGSLVALCGHHAIGDIIWDCEQYLKFWWLCGMKHKRMRRLPGKWVSVSFKPAVWFVKERRIDVECPIDMLTGDAADKEHHEWGQPVNWFDHWVRYLTLATDTVLDPFMGAGTTGIAAVQNGRRFVGIEKDVAHFDTACWRIEEAERQL